jgi:hypothetical protein
MRWASLLVLLVLFLPAAGLATTSAAHAQTDASSDAEARRLYGEARSAFEAGEFDAAVRSFRRAYLLSPRYALLYNIGQAELRAGHDALALEAFEAFLRQAPADDEHRGEVEERARMLRSMGVQAATEAEAEQAQQRAGGSSTSGAGESSAGGAGESGAGGAGESGAGESGAGESGAGESGAGESGAGESGGGESGGGESGGGESGGGNVAPWIVLGAGGAVLVVGAVLMGVAAGDASRVTSPMPGTPWSSLEGTASGAQTMWGVGIALLGVGAAAAVGGLVWALLDDGGGGDDGSRASARLRVGPGSIFVEGEF